MSEQGQLFLLMDRIILQGIFSHLNLREIKNVPLVCKFWASEGAISFRRFSKPNQINIHLAPLYVTVDMEMKPYKEPQNTESFIDKEREDMKIFLANLRLNHTLHISLLNFRPWENFTFRLRDEFCTYKSNKIQKNRWYRQGNNFQFANSLIGNFLQEINPFVNAVRWEMSLTTEDDLELLENFLEVIEMKITRMCLHLIMFPDKSLRVKKNHQRSQIKTLAITLPGAGYVSHFVYRSVDPILSTAGASTFFSLFPNISFLDLCGPRQHEGPLEVKDKISSFISAAQHLKHLSGIRIMAKYSNELEALRDYSQANPLRSLHFNLCHSYLKARNCLQTILNNQITSLESLDIIWRPETEEKCRPLLISSKNKLKNLSITGLADHFSDSDYEGEREVKFKDTIFDLFNLRENFPQRIFTELRSLTLILFKDDKVWDKIFSIQNLNLPQAISPKLRSLVISMVGDCDSQEIQKFPRYLFPGLRVFRHGKLREEGRLFVVCHHKYDDSGKLLGKWEWLGGVKNYLYAPDITSWMEYVYTAKYRMQMGLEFEEGFSDTAFHLEYDQHHLTEEMIRDFHEREEYEARGGYEEDLGRYYSN